MGSVIRGKIVLAPFLAGYGSAELGNKWSTITSLLKGPKNLKENDVKNKVYSAMRRGFRKVNKFIANVKRKRNAGSSSSHKLLKEEFIVKLNAVADGCFEDRFEVKQSALALARGTLSLT
jgi:hypothetical protein